jgi:putative transposase
MKRTYHPWLIIAFQAGILPTELMQGLPRSTKYDWQHKSLNACVGYYWYCQQEERLRILKEIYNSNKLMQVNRALLRVFAIKRFMHRHTLALKQGIQQVPGTVVNTIQKTGRVLGMGKTLKLLQLPYSSYLKMKNRLRCVQSPLGLCRIKHPAQLLPAEIGTIKKYCEDETYRHWPRSSIYYQLIKQGSGYFHLSTFYKYVSLLGLKRNRTPNRRKYHETGIRAAVPLQVIHADVTEFRLPDNRRVYIYAVVDNFNRHLLALKAYAEKRAVNMFTELSRVYEQYLKGSGRKECVLMTDDGSENYGEVKGLVGNASQPVLQHIIAQADVQFSNSMVEHAIKELKYHFLYHRQISNIEQLNRLLPVYIENDIGRPRAVLKGLTPAEALSCQQPESQCYAQESRKAAENRKIGNRKVKCCGFSF